MNGFFKKHRWRILGILLGAIGGYLYYRFVGCASGGCPITSNPYRMTIYGALMGFLLLDIFTTKEDKQTKK